LVCYHDSPLRKNWDRPSWDEVAESLKKAHAVNRSLVNTVNELYDEKGKTKRELEEVRSELRTSRLKNTILTSIFSSAITSAIIGAAVAIFKVWHS
jgi:hypothetical protein